MLTNARRRWPAVEFRVVNVAVQGPTAVPQIIDALAALDRDPAVDVIILARGGGSVEDLLPFSDEALCRAVFACRTPVISAIGHETDTPLVDFVADVRASTPTDAAKRAVPDLAEELRLHRPGPGAGWTGPSATCSTGNSSGSTRCAAVPCWPGRRRCSTQRADEVAALRDRADPHPGPPARAGRRRPAPHPGPAAGALPGGDTRARVRDRAARPTDGAARPRRGCRRRPAAGTPRRRRAGGTVDGCHRGAGRASPANARSASLRARSVTEVPQRANSATRRPGPNWPAVVERLEAGGGTLEESLALWERGEQLAEVCQRWLDGARARLDAARATSPDA